MTDLVLEIGTKVVKLSGNPFKSTFKVNTVNGYTNNPYTDKISYTFYEDDSSVECFRCEEYKNSFIIPR